MSRRFAKAGRYAGEYSEISSDDIAMIQHKVAQGFSHQAVAAIIGAPVSDVARFAALELAAVERPVRPTYLSLPTTAAAVVKGTELLSLYRGVISVPPTMQAIATEVAERYGVSLAVLKGPRQDRIAVRPRQEAMALIYGTGRYSYPRIGRFFGDRDHTTVIHGVRAHAARMAEAQGE